MQRWMRTLIGAAPAPQVRNSSALYEAGSHTRRTRGWNAPTTSANQAILGSLTTLRDRSRAASRNDGIAHGAIEELVGAIVGTGIKPLSQAKDPAFRKAVQELWLRWTDEADADGQFDFYGLQAQAVRTWLEAGEEFGRLRPRLPSDGLSVPLQVQNLEPELCPHTHDQAFGGRKIRAGIEFDALGRRVAYHFHPSRPEQDDFDASRLVRVPGDAVMHLYEPLRPGQLRGVPHLTQGLISLYDVDKYSDATLLRQQIANLFAGFIRKAANAVESDVVDPLTGQAGEAIDDKPVVQLEPGIMHRLDDGEEVQWSTPPEATGYADFMRQQLMQIAVAVGVPYEILTGDMRGVNDRTVRVLLNKFRQRVAAWQHNVVVFKFCRPVWRAWMFQAFLAGALPIPDSFLTDPEPWLAVKWTPPRVPYIQPVQDIQAQKDAIRAGLTSRSATVSEYGDDAEAIDLEQSLDNQRADDLGLKYDSDGRVAPAKASAAPAPDPEPTPKPTGEPE